MLRIMSVVFIASLLAACADTHPDSTCAAPAPFGETSDCVYYPGFGWAHPPVYHGSAPGAQG